MGTVFDTFWDFLKYIYAAFASLSYVNFMFVVLCL